jgi:hypothetical protein
MHYVMNGDDEEVPGPAWLICAEDHKVRVRVFDP